MIYRVARLKRIVKYNYREKLLARKTGIRQLLTLTIISNINRGLVIPREKGVDLVYIPFLIRFSFFNDVNLLNVTNTFLKNLKINGLPYNLQLSSRHTVKNHSRRPSSVSECYKLCLLVTPHRQKSRDLKSGDGGGN